jgi:hypothetical protein
VRLRHEPAPDLPPVGVEVDRGGDEDEQREAHVAEDPLDSAERQEVDGGRDDDQRDEHEEADAHVEEVVEDEAEAAQLRAKREHGENERGDEREHGEPRPVALLHEHEVRLLRGRDDATAHLGEDDDPEDADGGRPQHRRAHRRAGL